MCIRDRQRCVSSDQETKVTPLTSKVDSILSLHIPHIPLTIKDVFLDWAWKLNAQKINKKDKSVFSFFMFKKLSTIVNVFCLG